MDKEKIQIKKIWPQKNPNPPFLEGERGGKKVLKILKTPALFLGLVSKSTGSILKRNPKKGFSKSGADVVFQFRWFLSLKKKEKGKKN